MSDPQNNFLIFNEANGEFTTMSDADYASDLYRINGLIPMIADPKAHNKMFRQWSIMAKAIADMICDKGYDALDTSASDLKNNLKTAVKGLARDELQSDITTNANNITTNANNITALQTGKADIGHTHLTADITDITATSTEINTLHGITASTAELNILDGLTASTAELNILDGLTASTSELNTLHGITASTAELNILDGVTVTSTELNYLDGARSNIQQQINNLNISALFPLWIASRAYSVGDVVKTLTSSFWVYLECVVAGTSDTTEPTFTNVGELVTDGTVKWLVLDLRDSAPVGTIKQDLVKRDGWLKLNGATVNVADYPRLVSFLTANSLLNAYTATPDVTKFYYGDSNNEILLLPDFEGLFIENSASDTLDGVSAGLPNISGDLQLNLLGSNQLGTVFPRSATGPFYSKSSMNQRGISISSYSDADQRDREIGFDASRVNSIYGNSTTVQPPAVKLIPIIKY